MRILIGIPEKGLVDAEVATAVSNVRTCGHDTEVAYSDGRGVYGVAQARIDLAKQALARGFDRILMVDSDVVIPYYALEKLLDPPEPVVLGCYPFKNDTGDLPLYRLGNGGGREVFGSADIPDGRFEVKWGGLGCALVDVELFRRMPKPWFHWDERPSGRHTGEDAWFCARVRETGTAIVADGRVMCGHVGRKVYWVDVKS